MKRLSTTAIVGLLLLTGCDTPWAAAKRQREGITWEEWRQGIRSKEEKEEARDAARGLEQSRIKTAILMETARRNEYIAENPNLPLHIANAIVRGELARGMNAEQVRSSWGEPKQINRSVGSFGEHEQWVFGGGRYAYFRNGVLDSWQVSN